MSLSVAPAASRSPIGSTDSGSRSDPTRGATDTGTEVALLAIDPSDRKLHARSPVADALARFDLALQLGRSLDVPAATTVDTPLSTQGRTVDTLVDYKIGPPTRPAIHHDNGFLQNPADPGDPDPVDPVPPTPEDRAFHASQVTLARVGDLASDIPLIDRIPVPFTDAENKLDLPNGIEAYAHFLTGEGTDRRFDYGEFVEDDPSGKRVVDAVVADTREGVEVLYEQLLADDPTLANRAVTFEVTGEALSVGVPGADIEAYPATEDWQKAIGGHSVWSSTTVTVTPGADGGAPDFSTEITVHAEDRYNFNPGQSDIASGLPDAVNGRLETVGLAKQYDQFGETVVTADWTRGEATTVGTGNGGDGGRDR